MFVVLGGPCWGERADVFWVGIGPMFWVGIGVGVVIGLLLAVFAVRMLASVDPLPCKARVER